ncbi:MAG: hypothetical protein HY901_03765, partial [Deltaproteobacteria bacterium]|nr:hypothetical protein [Deltaproteobacteria bacterium]
HEGEEASFLGADSGSLIIPGVGSVAVRTGVKDAAEVETQLARTREELAGLLGKHQAEDVSALQVARQEAKSREGQALALEEQIAATLGGEGSLEDSREALRDLSGRLAEAAVRVGQVPEQIVEPEPSETISLDAELKKARKERAAAEKAREAAEEGRATADKALRKVTRERDDAIQSARTLEAQRAARIVAVGTLEEVAGGAKKAAASQALAQTAAQELEARLPPPFARASTKVPKLRQALEALDKASQDALRAADGARALLEKVSGEGLYSRLALVEEQLALGKRDEARLAARAHAILLLNRLAQTRQQQTERSVAEPIEAEVRTRLDYLRGLSSAAASTVVFSDLETAHVRVPSRSAMETPSQAALEALSWGAQEQVMLVVRLALGELLAKKGPGAEPQLVVLDDALVNADSARHKRALDLVAAAAERLQILILTAFPERYRALNATMHDLAAIKGSTAENAA